MKTTVKMGGIVRTVHETKTFEANGTFGAIGNAKKFLTDNGYSVGSMCSDEPIAIKKGDCYIAKWYNLGEDTPKIDGWILPLSEFREGGCRIEFFRNI